METKKQQLKKLKNERGLTLVELLAVIVILGIIATIAFVMIGNVMENSKKDAQIANAQQMIASAKLYEASGNTLNDGDSVSAKDLHEADFIENIVDPWDKLEIDMTNSTVTKTKEDSETIYTVTIEVNDESKGEGLTATEAELHEGRDEVWKD